jgi:serine/threonine protein kinase
MLEHEIKCQRLIECENTIKILDVFDESSFCFIVTEFCEGGDLYRLLKFSPKGLPEELVQKFGLQVAKALLKLKQMQIIHRDIKP